MRIDIVKADEPDSNFHYSNEYFRFVKSGVHTDKLLGDWNVDETVIYGRSVEISTGAVTWFNMDTTEEMTVPNCDVLENCYIAWKYIDLQKKANTSNLFEGTLL